MPGIIDSMTQTQRQYLPPGACGGGALSTLLRHTIVTKESETEYCWKTMLCSQSLREKQADENVLGGPLLYTCMCTWTQMHTHVVTLWQDSVFTSFDSTGPSVIHKWTIWGVKMSHYQSYLLKPQTAASCKISCLEMEFILGISHQEPIK